MDSYHFYCRCFEKDGVKFQLPVSVYVLKDMGQPILAKGCVNCDFFADKCKHLRQDENYGPTIDDTPDVFRYLSGFVKNGKPIRSIFLGLTDEKIVETVHGI